MTIALCRPGAPVATSETPLRSDLTQRHREGEPEAHRTGVGSIPMHRCLPSPPTACPSGDTGALVLGPPASEGRPPTGSRIDEYIQIRRPAGAPVRGRRGDGKRVRGAGARARGQPAGRGFSRPADPGRCRGRRRRHGGSSGRHRTARSRPDRGRSRRDPRHRRRGGGLRRPGGGAPDRGGGRRPLP